LTNAEIGTSLKHSSGNSSWGQKDLIAKVVESLLSLTPYQSELYPKNPLLYTKRETLLFW